MNALALRLNHGSAWLVLAAIVALILGILLAAGIALFGALLGLESTAAHDALLFGAQCFGILLCTGFAGFAVAACIERPGR